MKLNEYFDFNKRERRGLLVLSILLLIILILPLINQMFIPNNLSDTESIMQEIEEFQNSLVLKDKEKKIHEIEKQTKKKKKDIKSIRNSKITLADSLNLNESNIEDWMKLNFTKKQAKVIVNYIEKAKPLTDKSNLLKIYVIDEKKYKEIESYIYIVENDVSEVSILDEKEIKIELNMADTNQLISIGIPAYIASRIVKYRNLLGGFYTQEQLNEVYGISSDHLQILSNHSIDTTLINKINLNNCDFKTLNKHPYFNYETTKKVFNYLKLMESIESKEELLKNKIVSSEELIKIEPYIILQE
jgi:competence protein ComEA